MKSILKMKRGMDLLNNFKKATILVIGDLVMDHFIWGKVRRISPEAPVPIVEVNRESLMLGGAANVVNNIYSLGGKVLVCGVVGRDDMGKNLVHELRLKGIPSDGVIVEESRPTSVKTRVIAHSQQVVRFDREKKDKIHLDTMKLIIDYVKEKLSSVDTVVISDYAKGIISEELVEEVITTAKGKGKPVAVDPKVSHFDYYKYATIVTPNNDEASQASGVDIESDSSLLRAGEVLLNKLGSDAVLITRGEHGMSLFENNGGITHIPTVAKEVYDVSGAGDTVIGAMALAIASGANFKEAAVISNFAAGIVVGKVGTATVTPAELKSVLEDGLGAKKQR
ncbi:MAG: D-glycero-beta-D-manno-heptose-7-phosphate kinase [Deltaproteobacteria bacterium]|nr:D-glycero-beta-D-manno-heptose-7-phosphate kinase [Deltaproteobacteria bacterium]MBI3754712.1 D-glycero-beta-D-manno-heptose-7-phosphate kinase [Deltaproteobacteria bacterium]